MTPPPSVVVRTAMLRTLFGEATTEKIASSRLLMVGAGGIGCELLKDLVMSGFPEVDIVDLDTIDLSNLNRQFLFQKQHIGQSKALVARESALKFNPNATIIAHHANIKDAPFNREWFASFDLVINALDDLEARRHVNAMCVASGTTLLDSGTAGYLGQVATIIPGETECFDCQPKETPKTFPVCTIRSTPSTPIHCIVWAKSYLLPRLFSSSEAEDEDGMVKGAGEDAAELGQLQKEATVLSSIKGSMGTPSFTSRVFQNVFVDDIARLAAAPGMWEGKTRPAPLNEANISGASSGPSGKAPNPKDTPTLADQRVWDLPECYTVFSSSLDRLAQRYLALPTGERSISFDKDDVDTLDFVVAAANLRSHIFSIPPKSRFDVKAMAGNIIPAIATTNAIISGIVVQQAIKLLDPSPSKGLEGKRTIYLAHGGRRDRLCYLEDPASPNPLCYICQQTHLTVRLDTATATLGDLIRQVATPAEALGMGEEVMLEENGRLLYDIEFTDNAASTLQHLRISDGQVVMVTSEEEEDGREVGLYIRHTDGAPLTIEGDISKARTPRPSRASLSAAPPLGAAPSGVSGEAEGSGKRKIDDVVTVEDDLIILSEEPERKRVAPSQADGHAPIVVATTTTMDASGDITMSGISTPATDASGDVSMETVASSSPMITTLSEDSTSAAPSLPSLKEERKERNRKLAQLSGVFAVRKPAGMSSAAVVTQVKEAIGLPSVARRGVPKIGHGGTLDPMAEGVLVIGVGKGTSLLNAYQSCSKVYVGIGRLGFETDTDDATGTTTVEKDVSVTLEMLQAVLPQFRGDILQTPPIYSALKQDGKCLYEYARAGIAPPRPIEPRPIRIDDLTLEAFDGTDFTLRITCGGGTYIRSLIKDIAQAVGSAAHMTTLERVSQMGLDLGADTLDMNEVNLDTVAEAIIRVAEKRARLNSA